MNYPDLASRFSANLVAHLKTRDRLPACRFSIDTLLLLIGCSLVTRSVSKPSHQRGMQSRVLPLRSHRCITHHAVAITSGPPHSSSSYSRVFSIREHCGPQATSCGNASHKTRLIFYQSSARPSRCPTSVHLLLWSHLNNNFETND